MGYIRKKLTVKGSKGAKEDVDVLIDSGAERTFIIKDVAEQICDIRLFDEPRKVTLADGKTKVDSIGDCTFEMEIEGKPINDIMEVLDIERSEAGEAGKKIADLFLGAQTLQNFNLRLVFHKKGKGVDYIDTSDYEAPSYLL